MSLERDRERVISRPPAFAFAWYRARLGLIRVYINYDRYEVVLMRFGDS